MEVGDENTWFTECLQFSKPIKNTIDKMCEERAMGVRFYGLQIGTASREYDKILDRIWKV